MKAPLDTDPAFWRLYRERLMACSNEQRFLMGVSMFETARAMILASFPPGLTETETKRRLYERVYGEPAPDGFPN